MGEGKQEGRRALDSLGEPTEGPASHREKEKAVGVELGYHTYRIRRDLTNKSQDDDPEGKSLSLSNTHLMWWCS